MQTMQGELINNIAKLSELDKHIAYEKRKLGQAGDEFSRRRLAERLCNLEDQGLVRCEVASSNRKALCSQISPIREIVDQVLNDDTLANKIKTLFREQGITIASIFLPHWHLLYRLGLLHQPEVVVQEGDTPPSDRGCVKEWIKKHLKALGKALGQLAGKAASALPGIMGSIVSWLLNLLAKTTR